MRRYVVFLAFIALAGLLVEAAQTEEALSEATQENSPESSVASATEPIHIQVPPPPFSEGIFPCMDCHEDLETNREPREMEDFHEEIVLYHGGEDRWCLDCHDPLNRDVLRLANGSPVPFEESYRLCGQCHGEKYRDWRAGVHGKRVGSWSGKKTYMLCAHCHNPHDPRFKPLAPMGTPVPPGKLRELMQEPVEPLELPGILDVIDPKESE